MRLRVFDPKGEGRPRISSGVYLGDGRIAVTLHQIVDEIDEKTGELLRAQRIEATGLGRRGSTADVVGVEGFDIENELAILRLAENADIGARAAPIAQGSPVAGERVRGIGVTAREPNRLFGYGGRFGGVGRFASTLFGRPIQSGVSGTGVFNRLGELVGLASAGAGDPRTVMRSASALQGLMGDDYQPLSKFLEGAPTAVELFGDLGTESRLFGEGVGPFLSREEVGLLGRDSDLLFFRRLRNRREVSRSGRDLGLLNRLFFDRDVLGRRRSALVGMGDKAPPDELRELDELLGINQSRIDKLFERRGRTIPQRTDRMIRSLLGERERASEFHLGARPEELEAILSQNTDVLSGLLDPSLRGNIGSLRPEMFTRSYRAGQRAAQVLASPNASVFQRGGARFLSTAVGTLDSLVGAEGLVSGVGAWAKRPKVAKLGRFLSKGAKFGGALLGAAEVAEVFEVAAYVSGARERQMHEGVLGVGRHASQQMVNFARQLQDSPQLLEIIQSGVVPEGLSEDELAIVKQYQDAASDIEGQVGGVHSDLVERRDMLSRELLYMREFQAQGKNPYASRVLAPFSMQSPLEKDYLKSESEEFFGIPLGPLSHVIRIFDTIEKFPAQRVWQGWKDPGGEQHITEVQQQLAEVEGVLKTAGFSGIAESKESRLDRLAVLKDRYRSNEQVLTRVREQLEPRTFVQDVRDRGFSRARSVYRGRGVGVRDPRAVSEKRADVLRGELADNERQIKLMLGSYGVNVESLDNLGFGGLDKALNEIVRKEGADYYDNADMVTFAQRFMTTAFRSGDTSHVFPELKTAVADVLDERLRISRELLNLPTEQLKNLEAEKKTLTGQIRELEPAFMGGPDTSMGRIEGGRGVSGSVVSVGSRKKTEDELASAILAAQPDSVLGSLVGKAPGVVDQVLGESVSIPEQYRGKLAIDIPDIKLPRLGVGGLADVIAESSAVRNVRKQIQELTPSGTAADYLKARPASSFVVIKSLEDVLDGDTVRGLIHHAGEVREGDVRFKGFDAAEASDQALYLKWSRSDPNRPQDMLDREKARGQTLTEVLRGIIRAYNPGREKDFLLPLDMLEGVWETGKFGRPLATPIIPGVDYYGDAMRAGYGRKTAVVRGVLHKSKVDLGGEYIDTVKARYTEQEWNAAQRFREDLGESLYKDLLEQQEAAVGLPGKFMEQQLSFLMAGGTFPGETGTYKSRLEGFQETVQSQMIETQKRVSRDQRHVSGLRDRYESKSVHALSKPRFLPEYEEYLKGLKAELDSAESKLKAEEDLLKQYQSLLTKSGRTLEQIYREIAKSEKYILESGRREALVAAQEFVSGISETVVDHTRRRSLLPSSLVLDTGFVEGLESGFREDLADESNVVDAEIKKWTEKVESQREVLRSAEKDRLGLEQKFADTGDALMLEPGSDLTKARQAEAAAASDLKYSEQQLKFYERTRDVIDQAVLKSEAFEDKSTELAHAKELLGVAESFDAYRQDVGEGLFDIRDSQKGLLPLTAYSEEAIKNISGRVHPLWQQWGDDARVGIEALQAGGQERIVGLDERLGRLRTQLGDDEARLTELNEDIRGRQERGEVLPESLLQEAQGLDKSVEAQKESIAKLESIRERYLNEQERLTAALTQIRVALEKHARQLGGMKEDIKHKSVSQMLREGLTPAEINKEVTAMLGDMSGEERSKYVAANKAALARIGKSESERKLQAELEKLPFEERFAREKELEVSTREGSYQEWKRQHLYDQRLQEREMRRRNNEVLRRREHYAQEIARVPFRFAESMWTRGEIGARGEEAKEKLKIDHLEKMRRVQDDMYLSANQKEKQLHLLRQQYARERMKIEEEVGKAQSDVLNKVWKDFLTNIGGDLWDRAQNRFTDMVEGWLWGKPIGGGHTGQPSEGGLFGNLGSIGKGIDWLFGTGRPQQGQVQGGKQGGLLGSVGESAIDSVVKDQAPGLFKKAWDWGKGLLGIGGGSTAGVGLAAEGGVTSAAASAVPSETALSAWASEGVKLANTSSSTGVSTVLNAAGPLVVAEVGIGALQGGDTGGKPSDVLSEIWGDISGWFGDTFSFDNSRNDMVARRVGARLAQRNAMKEAREMGHRSAMDLLMNHAKGFTDESQTINQNIKNTNDVTNVSNEKSDEEMHVTVNVYENQGGRQKLKDTHRALGKIERQKVVRKNEG